MKKIVPSMIATVVALSISTAVFAADAAKPFAVSAPAVEVQKNEHAVKADTEATKAKVTAEATENKAKAKTEADAEAMKLK